MHQKQCDHAGSLGLGPQGCYVSSLLSCKPFLSNLSILQRWERNQSIYMGNLFLAWPFLLLGWVHFFNVYEPIAYSLEFSSSLISLLYKGGEGQAKLSPNLHKTSLSPPKTSPHSPCTPVVSLCFLPGTTTTFCLMTYTSWGYNSNSHMTTS